MNAAQAKEMLPLTEHEAYIGTIFGRMFFLPAMHFLRMRHLDRRKAEAVMREVCGMYYQLPSVICLFTLGLMAQKR